MARAKGTGSRKTSMVPAGRRAAARKVSDGPMTQAELDAFAARVVAKANAMLGVSDDAKQALAGFLFTELFGADVRLALDPVSKRTDRYRAVAARAGESLLLDAEELSEFVAVGAINHHVKAVSFRRVPWSFKRALVPLARRGMWKELRAATDVLDRDHAGIRALREHLKDRYPEVYLSRGADARALAGETTRMVNAAGKLDEGAVARYVDDLNKASPDARREVREKIQRGLQLLTYLRDAIEPDDGG